MVLQIGAGESIERRERFVEQQHFRARHQRPRQSHALRLPAGKFARPDAGLVGKSDACQRSAHARITLRGRQILKPEADIVGDGEPWQQARLLEYDADLLMRRMDGDAAERYVAARRHIEARHRAQQSRLAAAGAADDGENLAGLHGDADLVERAHAVRIDLGDVVEHQHVALLAHAVSPRAPNRSSQRRNGVAAATIRPSAILPRMAKVMMAATICAGLPSCWPSISR